MTPLRRRMTEDMQVRNFSPHTQNSYMQQVSLFARHFSKSPDVEGIDPAQVSGLYYRGRYPIRRANSSHFQ